MNSTLALASVLLLTGQPGDAAPSGSTVTLKHCVVSLTEHVQVPAEEDGVITEILTKEGTLVKKGQILAQIDDTQAQMRLKAAGIESAMAKMQAENRVNVEAAVAGKDVADAEVADAEAINIKSPGSVTITELRKLRFQAIRSKLQIKVAEFELSVAAEQAKVKGLEMDAANAEIKRRKIDAAHDGVIVQVYKRTGEWAKAGEPILRLVRMDRLRVEGFVNADDYLPSDVSGKSVTIHVNVGRNKIVPVNGVISYYSPIVEASGEYRVWAEIENRAENGFWVFRPGLNATMDIHVGGIANPNASNTRSGNANSSAYVQPVK